MRQPRPWPKDPAQVRSYGIFERRASEACQHVIRGRHVRTRHPRRLHTLSGNRFAQFVYLRYYAFLATVEKSGMSGLQFNAVVDLIIVRKSVSLLWWNGSARRGATRTSVTLPTSCPVDEFKQRKDAWPAWISKIVLHIPEKKTYIRRIPEILGWRLENCV